MMHIGVLGAVSLLCIAVAATILIVFLVKKPIMTLAVKGWLFLGLGVFPALAAGASTVKGMEGTTEREFCGSCHVMIEHYENSNDKESQSLAARHSRNPFFGNRSCYVCHADYGMYGYAMTKAGGMGHVYHYYIGGYNKLSLAEAKEKIHLRKPYDNTNCRQCHTTSLYDWRRVPDHESLKEELLSNKVSCASAGCHGYAHPFTKKPDDTHGAPVSSAIQTVPQAQGSASAGAKPATSASPSKAKEHP